MRGVVYLRASDAEVAEDLALDVIFGDQPEWLIEHLPEPAEATDFDFDMEPASELTPREARARFGEAVAAAVPAIRTDQP